MLTIDAAEGLTTGLKSKIEVVNHFCYGVVAETLLLAASLAVCLGSDRKIFSRYFRNFQGMARLTAIGTSLALQSLGTS